MAGGFFDGLLNATQSPLFLGGANLLMGGGPQGMMEGMRTGAGFQDRQRKVQQEEQQRNALSQIVGGMNMNDAERGYMLANPETAAAILQSQFQNRFDPMAGIKRQTAEANLAQTQAENGMFDLKRRAMEAQIAKDTAQIEQGRNGKYGLQPVYGTDENGNIVIMQVGPNGEAVQTKLPQGVRIDPAAKARAQAEGSELGKAQGTAKVNLPLAEYNAKKLTALLDGVLNDPYLGNMTGPVAGRMPNLSGASNRVQSRIDQIQGKTFLAAFESLKGGGQITEIEGAKAEQSLQRLQNARVGTQDYIEALREFRRDVDDLLQVARAKAGGNYTTPAPQGGGTGGWSIRRVD